MELALPNGWHDVKPEGESTKIAATDGHGTRLVVRVYPKEDFKDAKAVADFAVKKLKLADNDGVKTEDIQIGGKPAVRMSIVGTRASEKRAGFLITIIDADSQYIEVQGATDASSFAKANPGAPGTCQRAKNCAGIDLRGNARACPGGASEARGQAACAETIELKSGPARLTSVEGRRRLTFGVAPSDQSDGK